ncbi:MAG: nucleotidyl transferase AbiEii/AbiGii toxin family protein [Bdellovibrionales bacterium]|nr:nucleotidyl transferase AbiEii/AbiGii toxin family protein [Bdellovibrionales bacterium]
MFKREHHVRVASILQALDGDLLKKHDCLFGGGTAIVLTHGEYRESVDIDFLVSNRSGYQALRHLLTGAKGIQAITRQGMRLDTVRDIRADQYGIRTMLSVLDTEIKLEIVQEARITLEESHDRICGVCTLTALDMAATKLLANSDRWADDSVFSRDLIDLAMLRLPRKTFSLARKKARDAYGESVERDLAKAVQALKTRKNRLNQCMEALKIDGVPKALLWKRIRGLPRAP